MISDHKKSYRRTSLRNLFHDDIKYLLSMEKLWAKRKPPVLGKNRKSNAAVKKTTPTKKTPVPSTPKEEDEAPPPPKGAYNMDFDKFDDPNFNPFETKTKEQKSKNQIWK